MKKKFWWPKFGPKGPKLGPKLGFLSICQNWFQLVFLEIAYNDSLQQFLRFSRGITHEKNFWGPNMC